MILSRPAIEGFLLLLLIASAIMLSSAIQAQECDTTASSHSATTVVYGHISGARQATVFTPTADGAVQATDAATGTQLWAFTPPETSSASAASGERITEVRILRFDSDGDGTIDISSGDRVWLYFGLRDAGPYYYALDITDRQTPRVLWTIGADSLEGLADAWSTPTIARVRVSGATQNGENFVLIFGGGYNAEGAGAHLFMVDAATGRLLWSSGAADGSDLKLADMTHPMPTRIAVVDTDGDAYADRMYAVDVTGVVWRFDIWNGRARDSLVTGGVLADLSDDTGDRVFFNAPDVALIRPFGGEPYYNIAVGSGAPDFSADSTVDDYFFAVRDRAPLQRRTQSEYASLEPIVADDLPDISANPNGTAIPPEAAGWKINTAGERVAADSVTADGVVLFTTFRRSADAGECAVGSTRVYAVKVDSGTAGLDLNDDDELTADDLSMELPSGQPLGEVRVQLGMRSVGSDGTGGLEDSGPAPEDSAGGVSGAATKCFVGARVLAKCVSVGALIRTYWQRPSTR
jgi:type IV pilus assembly protein PilY1